MIEVELLTVGVAVDVQPSRLAGVLESRLPLRCRAGAPLANAERWTRGGAVDGDLLLDALLAACPVEPRRRRWTLAIVDAELTSFERDRVFGAAEVAGSCAVVGAASLRPASPDPERFLERLVKEATHELGHVAGLSHCPDRACVMFPSASVEDVDRRPSDLCAPCAEALGNLLAAPVV